jgi:hypothetical protein
MTSREVFRRINLFQSPMLTVGHRWIGVAALLGVLWVAFHLATVVVTILTDGPDWGINAWLLDIVGLLAGLFFAIQCWISSNRSNDNYRKVNYGILIWATITFFSRIFDSLMLFGLFKWGEIYLTPVGVTLWSNIMSEVILGMAFTVTALIGALILLFWPQASDQRAALK